MFGRVCQKLFFILIFALFFVFNFQSVWANYYETLPKGISVFGYRWVQTSNIKSSWNHTSIESPYQYKFQLDSSTLSQINEISEVLDEIKSISPETYQQLNLGEYEIKANADIQVHAFGLGYGLTNKLNIYGFVPFYQTRVFIEYNRSKPNNYAEIQRNLDKKTNCQNCQALSQLIDAIPDIGAAEFQYILTDYLGYEDAGDWYGSDFGDSELGMIYQINRTKDYGTAMNLGVVAPTGKVNNPDILQDIGFGDGQWDAFGEYGGSYHFNRYFSVNSKYRFTYQFASEKTKRVPYNKDIFISGEKAQYMEKLGNKHESMIEGQLEPNDWVILLGGLNYSYIEKTQYRSLDPKYKKSEAYLENNTETQLLATRIAARITTITPYLKSKFPIPATLEFSYLKAIEGQNIPKYDRLEIEWRMLF